jgi:iron(II)-dependent oxidoreductase
MSEMILIPKGPFVFGINHTDMRTIVKKLKEEVENFYLSEYQREEKTLDNFYIDRFEVTNDKYNVFVKEKKHRQPKYSNYPQFNSSHQPVVGIGWADAELYCKWANKRLPTEEEWEKAARGTDGRVWPWGNDADDTRYNGRKKGFYAPINVGSFPAGNSPYGVSDMAGNVWEMTSSNWQGSAKTMKGGSFLNTNGDVRTMVRWAAADELNGAKWLGFRCVMDISEFKREQGIRTQR